MIIRSQEDQAIPAARRGWRRPDEPCINTRRSHMISASTAHAEQTDDTHSHALLLHLDVLELAPSCSKDGCERDIIYVAGFQLDRRGR